MSKITQIEILSIKNTDFDEITLTLSDNTTLALCILVDPEAHLDELRKVREDLERLIHYREKQRNSVRNYYDANLRKKAKK